MVKINSFIGKNLFEAVLNKNAALFNKNISELYNSKYEMLVEARANEIRKALNDSVK